MAKTLNITLLAALIGTACFGCSPDDGEAPGDDLIARGRAWVDSRHVRRETLEGALVSTTNTYAEARLESYALRDGWDALPVRTPRVAKLRLADLGSFDARGSRPAKHAVLDDDWQVEWTDSGLRNAGRHALETYPMRSDHRLAWVTASTTTASEAGFWTDDDGWVGGLVVEAIDGEERASWTCATCHARVDDGTVTLGASNHTFDGGGIYRAGGITHGLAESWARGTSDPTWDGVDNPSAIPDLRHIRYQRALHHTATLRNDILALATRIETLLIVSSGARARPPRDLVIAMAYTLWTDATFAVAEPPAAFVEHCSTCHAVDGGAGPALPIRDFGLDDAITTSPARGTGYLRVPSLVGAGDRNVFFHDGRARTLDEALELHPSVFTIDDDDEVAILEYLRKSVPGGSALN